MGSQYGAIGPSYNKYHMDFSGGSHRDDSVDVALVTYLGFVDTVGWLIAEGWGFLTTGHSTNHATVCLEMNVKPRSTNLTF